MRKKMFYGVLSALTLGLAACSNNDDFATGASQNQKAEYDQTQYIAVQISAPSDAVTRADGAFENGATNESAINVLDFFFYDVAGNPTATPVQMTKTDIENAVEAGNAMFQENSSGDNVTRLLKSVVPAKLTQGQNLPSQIICIVNGSQTALDDIKGNTLTQLIDRQRESFRTGDDFTMTNSVYYGQNVLTGRANQRLCATPINANSQLFGTEEEALTNVKEGTDGAFVDIYVERLAAKVGLTMGAGAVQGYTLTNVAGGDITLTFEPTYWSMNATDKNVYLTKRYGVENDDKSINLIPDYGQINNALTGNPATTTPWWNAPANYRSYWGASPSYFANNYPDVSDDVNDLDGNETQYTSYYYSYSQIEDEAKKANIGAQAIAANNKAFSTSTTTEGTTTCAGFVYTRETTVSRYRINDIEKGNPAAAVASVVLVGKYGVPEGTVTDEDGTFYIDRNAGTNGTFYGTTAAAMEKLAFRQRIVFKKANGTDPATDCFTLQHPTKVIRDMAGTKLSGRLVTIQITEDNLVGDPLYYYDLKADGSGEYVQITADTKDADGRTILDKVNAQLLSVGYMDKFGQGLAFFSVPVRHLNWSDAWYANGKYDWEHIGSGALGVVRNHVYNLTINSVRGLGTALRDPNQPIVPAKEEANQYIAARINILAWHVAKTWSVNL